MFRCQDAVRQVGVKEGDIIDVASDMLSIMVFCRKNKLQFDMNIILNDLINVVGEQGTVMIRTFNWDFCRGIPFDIRSTPSQVGSLGTFTIKRNDFKRTKHPLYSWMVYGKYAKELCDMENTNSFGIGSIFDFQYKNNAKLLRLGNANRGFTQIHHAETLAKVPYRFKKEFTGKYIDEFGIESIKTYSMFVRYLDVDVHPDAFPDVDEEWERNSIVTTVVLEGILYQTTRLREAIDFSVNDFKNNFGNRVCIINGEKGFKNYVNYEFKNK